MHAFRAWYMDTMQSAADSMQALFPCNHTDYDNNKGQVLASVYYHYILSSFKIHRAAYAYTPSLIQKMTNLVDEKER